MTFENLCTSEFSVTLSGSETIGLYIALAREEESLDHHQLVALERLRAILYEYLSVEELEGIGLAYAGLIVKEGDL
ncbi:MAG: hypothetical protein CVV47_01705 [Spirochaetae bacterium HGW-Spirochaetae-3]|nr:MAG: hypothetical protein CVV47_01705 [Spirochaetae bacterium HGW-Spirochaetae-3]